MNKTMLKHPVAIAGYIGSLLLIIAGCMSWLTIPTDSLASFAATTIENAVNPKRTMMLVLGVVTLILGLLAARRASKSMALLNVILGVLLLVPIMTAYVPEDDPTAQLLGLEGMDGGYTVAVIAWLVFFIASIAALFVYKKEAPEKK